MERFFNTAGPIKPDLHYYIDPLKRIDLDEVLLLIRQQKYFVMHAPRQTGKTTCLLALRDYLNVRDEFVVVYANVEAGQAFRNDVTRVVGSVCQEIASRTSYIIGNKTPEELYMRLKKEVKDNLLSTLLTELCILLEKPLVLFLDEIDALVGDGLVSVLR